MIWWTDYLLTGDWRKYKAVVTQKDIVDPETFRPAMRLEMSGPVSELSYVECALRAEGELM